jgi:hypothetical protein
MNDSVALFDPVTNTIGDTATATAPDTPGGIIRSGPSAAASLPPPSAPPTPGPKPSRGSVLLNALMLRRLRESRLLSQQDVADDCWRRNIQLSIATIKRVERSHRVRFRIAHTLAGYYGVPVDDLLS